MKEVESYLQRLEAVKPLDLSALFRLIQDLADDSSESLTPVVRESLRRRMMQRAAQCLWLQRKLGWALPAEPTPARAAPRDL